MYRFELSIKTIENEWAELLLSLDGCEATFCFEYVPNDALCDLLESAIRITAGIESMVIFPNGPQQEHLSVKKLEDNFCRVETECACLDLPVRQFCKAILRMFDAYAFAFSRDEYSKNWHAFPDAELERLRALYHQIGGR